MSVNREHWLRHVREVVRSRHYTWLPQGLGGQTVEEAMTWLATDIMHVCKLAGVPVDRVMSRAKEKFNTEEAEQFPAAAPNVEIPHALSDKGGDAVVSAHTANDAYDAEIVRGVLQSEGISCRVETPSVGGRPNLNEAQVLVLDSDIDAAREAIDQAASNDSK